MNSLRNEYVASTKKEKPHFARLVQEHIRSLNPPGRFLKQASNNDPYIDIGIKLSIDKTSQALREGKPVLEKKIKSGELVVEEFEPNALIAERSRLVYPKVFPHLSANAVSVSTQSDAATAPIGSQNPDSLHHSNCTQEPRAHFSNEHNVPQDNEGTEDFLPNEVPKILSHDVSFYQSRNNLHTPINPSIDSSDFVPEHFYDENGKQIELNKSFRESAVGMEYEWRTRNSLYLQGLGEREKMKRRASSMNMMRYIQTLQAIESESDSDSKYGSSGTDSRDSFQQKINDTIVYNQNNLDRSSVSIASLSESFQMSVDMNDKMDDGRGKYSSMKFSILSRRSTRMSLTLRQSLIGSFGDGDDEESDDEEDVQESHSQQKPYDTQYIPDVFASRRDRWRSTMTESSGQLISKIYGNAAAEILAEDPNKMSIVLDNILAPVTHDDIMNELDDL